MPRKPDPFKVLAKLKSGMGVEIRWLDTHAYDLWTHVFEVVDESKNRPTYLHSIGYLVSIDDTHVSLVTNLIEGTGTCFGTIHIPLGVIEEVRKLDATFDPEVLGGLVRA